MLHTRKSTLLPPRRPLLSPPPSPSASLPGTVAFLSERGRWPLHALLVVTPHLLERPLSESQHL